MGERAAGHRPDRHGARRLVPGGDRLSARGAAPGGADARPDRRSPPGRSTGGLRVGPHLPGQRTGRRSRSGTGRLAPRHSPRLTWPDAQASTAIVICGSQTYDLAYWERSQRLAHPLRAGPPLPAPARSVRRGSAMLRRRLATAVLAAAAGLMLLAVQLPAGAQTLGAQTLGAQTLADPTAPVTGNATYFDALGAPYGGCGLPQAQLDTQNFVALNVYNTPGDYAFYPRPIPASMADKIGLWDNGRNCGRWVQVSIGDYCTGVNDGAPGQSFCRN